MLTKRPTQQALGELWKLKTIVYKGQSDMAATAGGMYLCCEFVNLA